jgi:hypothetical protein
MDVDLLKRLEYSGHDQLVRNKACVRCGDGDGWRI